MSTEKIRAALGTLGFTHDVSGALAEVEAIEKAVVALSRLNLGDKVYDVRERCDMSAFPRDMSSWDHPDVKEWSDATVLIEAIAAQRNAGTAGAVGPKEAGASGPQE